jgi:hypothetical protein
MERDHVDAVSFSGDGTLMNFEGVSLVAVDDTPPDPPNSEAIIWMDSTTGDLKVKLTDSGGTTKTATLADFSAL